MPTPSSENSTRAAPSAGGLRRFTAMVCAATGLACSAAQVRPPAPEDCPDEAQAAMWDKKGPLQLIGAGDLYAIIDVHQPGEGFETGVYRDGPIVGRITKGDANMPAGTLLYGHLWTGPGIPSVGDPNVEAVIARYTEVLLPDGRKFPVCIVLGNTRQSRWEKVPGSKPGATILPREVPVSAVDRWP